MLVATGPSIATSDQTHHLIRTTVHANTTWFPRTRNVGATKAVERGILTVDRGLTVPSSGPSLPSGQVQAKIVLDASTNVGVSCRSLSNRANVDLQLNTAKLQSTQCPLLIRIEAVRLCPHSSPASRSSIGNSASGLEAVAVRLEIPRIETLAISSRLPHLQPGYTTVRPPRVATLDRLLRSTLGRNGKPFLIPKANNAYCVKARWSRNIEGRI